MPRELQVRQLFDQSLFVRAAINGVVREAAIAALLTAMMILLFLGSWRSTIIVCISIPLSILTSLAILSLIGETINVMTLGGMALAVGILVDDATVEIENTHRNMAMKKPLVRAVLDGAQQIAAPAFVSTLSICIVFVPVLLLTGAAKYLFTPLALAVVFAMLASYLLSRTLIPNMVHYMLKPEVKLYALGAHGESAGGKGFIWRIHYLFNRRFEMMRASYTGLLHWSLDHRGPVLAGFGLFVAGLPVPAGVHRPGFLPHRRFRPDAPACHGAHRNPHRGNRSLFSKIDDEIRHVIPAREIDTIIDNIGIPFGGFNLAFGDISTLGTSDGDILISLKPEDHGPTALYIDKLRKDLNRKFPEMTFFFEPANITNQILNFGLPAPIDLQVVGRDPQNYAIAQTLAERISHIPGAADVHVHQVVDYPELRVNVDRDKAGQLGLQQRDVSNSLLISLSSSGQVQPNEWLNWNTGVSYFMAVQTPQYRMDSVDALMRTPIAAPMGSVLSTTATSLAGTSGISNSMVGSSPSQSSLAYGNPGAASGGPQLLSNLASIAARRGARDHKPLQRAAGIRRLCQCGPARFGERRHSGGEDHAGFLRQAAAGHQFRPARPGPHHGDFVLPAGHGDDLCGGSGVPADGR